MSPWFNNLSIISASRFLSLVNRTVLMGAMISDTLLRLYVAAVTGFFRPKEKYSGSNKVLWLHTYKRPLGLETEYCKKWGFFNLEPEAGEG